MERKKTRLVCSLSILGMFLLLLPSVGSGQVNCGYGGTGTGIQAAITAAASGDTISVTGICAENIDIPKSVTIDGGGTAEIHAPVSTQSAVRIRAGVVTLKNFHSIQGGQDGVYVVSSTWSTILNNTIQSTHRDGVFVDFGGAPTINGNTIKNTARYGIIVFANAYAAIINNTITNNPGDGILVTEGAVARIGFLSSSQTTASPNTITGNEGDGINVTRASQAWIVGNTISNNDGNGVTVTKVSHAGVSNNTINQNGVNGIEVSQGSGANLGSDTGTTIFELPNTTTINNGGRGLECSVGGYVDGRLGTLNGVLGRKSITRGCVNSLTPLY